MRFGWPEALILLLIIVILFGWNRLPQIGKGLGEGIRNFKSAIKDGDKKNDQPEDGTDKK